MRIKPCRLCTTVFMVTFHDGHEQQERRVRAEDKEDAKLRLYGLFPGATFLDAVPLGHQPAPGTATARARLARAGA